MLAIRTVTARAVRAAVRRVGAPAAQATVSMMSTTTEEQINAGEETEVEEVEVDEDIDVASMNADELIAYINAHEDVARTQLPAKADEKLAAHITPLWTAVEAAGTEPAAVQADLAEMLETVDRQPTCVSRYFDGPTLRKEESELVMAVLFEGKITKMADIADKELFASEHFSASRPCLTTFTMADVTVQSAIALTDAQQEKIRGAVARYLPAGKDDSDVDFVVDGSIAGGLIVTVDDVVIDLSAASFLNSAAASVSISEERA
ncbi:hypothetical protein FNF28_06953 [Cafeteria roenbergensis]|uniref:Uncharacterized protein n=1 Tax=Cafeteria roenbergensis TaxID=33653 RepID=A0A5A8CL58_CAFRO|nr:hypothetical protein FNF28_06953 [Cafeteria roenbergensis]